MDARNIGAAEPDDSRMFEAITADLTIDTAAIEQAITAEQHPAAQALPDAPAPNPDDREHPATPAPTPKPEPKLSPDTSPSSVPITGLPEIETPPDLVVPPKPEPTTSTTVNWWSNAFPHLVWLSVISGLVGQIYGWSQTFGGTLVAIAVAVILGGTFEFIMVAASSRGLRDIGRNRPWWQAIVFLLAGTACAALAFWMNLHHFTGKLALAGAAAAAATAIGYLAHVAVHCFDELDNRREHKEWEAERSRVEAEIKARGDKARAEHDAYQAELRKARTEELKSRTRQTAPVAENQTAKAVAPRPASPSRGRESKPAGKPGGPVAKDDAVRIGVELDARTPAKLRAALTEAGYTLPKSSTTIENWCRDIKAQLGETN